MSFAGLSLETAMRRTCGSQWACDVSDCGVLHTFLLLLLAAFMREVILVSFSVSCFARWVLICMLSAIVNVDMRCRARRKLTTSARR